MRFSAGVGDTHPHAALRAASTIIAVPFSIILILMMLGLAKALWQTESIQKTQSVFDIRG